MPTCNGNNVAPANTKQIRENFTDDSKKKKEKSNLWLWILLGVLIASLLIGGFLLYRHKSKEHFSSSSSTVSSSASSPSSSSASSSEVSDVSSSQSASVGEDKPMSFGFKFY